MKRTFSVLILTLLLLSMLMLAFHVQPVRARGPIFIRADGSIDPPTANITTSDYVTYTFTDDDYDGIVVERDNVVVDGAGYFVLGWASLVGIQLAGRSNVTLKNMRITGFWYGIELISSSNNNSISGNSITNNGYGIWLEHSSNNTISGNHIASNSDYGIRLIIDSNNNSISGNSITANAGYGIMLGGSSNYNTISKNDITNNQYGIQLASSSNNTISRNNVTANNPYGIALYSSRDNTISGNRIANNGYGVWLDSFWNSFFGNSFIDNTNQAYSYGAVRDVWDDGYPSGGNYWSDYTGEDAYNGPYQNLLGSDGIGDVPYVIDANNRDGYPLMNPWVPYENGTIYIRADGRVNPSGAPIHRSGDYYVLTGNISSAANGIVIERDNMTLNGAGYTVQGTGVYGSNGIFLDGGSNVTVKNVTIKACFIGIWLNYSSSNSIMGNNITNNDDGIYLGNSLNNSISGNSITNNWYDGIRLVYSAYNSIVGNNITNDDYGITLSYSWFNSVVGNNVANNDYGICFQEVSYSRVFHNNFINNTQQFSGYGTKNLWNNGCEGNYWSDYTGVDSDGDGIGDTPYIIDYGGNSDNYPLMNPYWIPADVNHDLKINIFDVVKITGTYGATPASPYWNPHADIAQPFGKIDIFDVVLCTGHYGEKYP